MTLAGLFLVEMARFSPPWKDQWFGLEALWTSHHAHPHIRTHTHPMHTQLAFKQTPQTLNADRDRSASISSSLICIYKFSRAFDAHKTDHKRFVRMPCSSQNSKISYDLLHNYAHTVWNASGWVLQWCAFFGLLCIYNSQSWINTRSCWAGFALVWSVALSGHA